VLQVFVWLRRARLLGLLPTSSSNACFRGDDLDGVCEGFLADSGAIALRGDAMVPLRCSENGGRIESVGSITKAMRFRDSLDQAILDSMLRESSVMIIAQLP
jgi:hypothetical protein